MPVGKLARVLRRVVAPALAASLAWTIAPAAPAVARQAGPRVVLITVDGTSIEDWIAADAFSSLASVGLLATRTGTDSDDPTLLRAAAYTSLGAGAPAVLEHGSPAVDAGRGVLAGALGEALERRGLAATAIGDATGEDMEDAAADRAVMRTDATLASAPAATPPGPAQLWLRDFTSPGARRTDYVATLAALQRSLAWASVVVVDLGDTARADRQFAGQPASRAPWIARALRDASAFVEQARPLLNVDDTIIVASLVPPLDRVRAGAQLAAVATTGGRGLPYSGTTRRHGVLGLTDLGPTILERLAVPVPDEMQGRAVRFEPAEDPARTARELDEAFLRARAARRPLTRLWLIAASVLAGCAFVMIAAGRGRGPRGERFPRRARDLIATALIGAAAAPAAMLLAPRLPGETVAAMGWWTLVLAVGTALIARAALGARTALGVVAALDAALVAGDLLAGTPLAARSALGFQVAGGGRFYGIDEGMLGVLLAGALVAAAAWLDAGTTPRRRVAGAAFALLAVAVFAGAPAFGSKFGAAFTLVPAFGFLVATAAGRRFDRVAAVGVGLATTLIAGTLAAVDALASPATRSHIGREIAGGTPVGPLIGRKITSFIEITGTTIWLPVAVAIAVPIALLLFRRANLLARGFWGLPGRRRALVAIAVGCLAAMPSNDTGILVVAPAAVIGAAAFYVPLLISAGQGWGARRAKK